MSYLLSLVVPTKNRYPYLKHLIQYIKSFNSDKIELVIQDNATDNAEIVGFIKEEDFVHLKYYHTKESISVGLNSDKAKRMGIDVYMDYNQIYGRFLFLFQHSIHYMSQRQG